VQDVPINHEILRAVVRAMVHLRFNLEAHLNERCHAVASGPARTLPDEA
jgi:hypothetical protein